MLALQEISQSVSGVAQGRFDGPLGARHDGRCFGDAKSDEVEAIDGETLAARQARDRVREVELVVDPSYPPRKHSEQGASTCASPTSLIGGDGKEPSRRSPTLRIELRALPPRSDERVLNDVI